MIPTGANEKRAVPQIGRYTAGVLNRGLKLRLLGWMPRKDLVPVARSTKLAASQLRAKSQSRCNVVAEISSASAASVSVKPPKKRSSITLAAREALSVSVGTVRRV